MTPTEATYDRADVGALGADAGTAEDVIAAKRIVFLVGGPRTGTTWLQLLLSRHPSIATANETHLFTTYAPSLFTGWQHHLSNARPLGLHSLMTETEYFGLVKHFVCAVLLKIAERKPTAEIILEKTPDHVLYWENILKIFPDAWFLHIVRDPRSVVASLSAAGSGWGAQWASPVVLDNCETWIKYMAASRQLKAATKNFLEVRYEDLWERGDQTLMAIFSWLGLAVSQGDCQNYLKDCEIDKLRGNRLQTAPWDLASEPKDFYRKGGIETWRSELTRREVYLVEHLAHSLMTQYGYAPTETRPRLILPLIVASRIQTAIMWRLDARRARLAHSSPAQAPHAPDGTALLSRMRNLLRR